jgi:DNA primase catalytic core
MRFPPNFLDELRARLPVSEVVGRRVRLKRAGREWKGLSPFNKEKTPSFFVNDQKASWFDFSAGRNGDIFDFVMATEGVEFPEAVERLAAMAGVPMPVATQEAEAEQRHRRGLHDVIELAAKFFEVTLASRAGAKARGYLADRGLEPATQLKFRLGYAPPDRFALKENLGGQGVSVELMVEAGLLVAADDIPVPYDRFRDRVMFPISDLRGRVVAFGGRALDKDAPAKYLNSPETPLFHKGGLLYNAAPARAAANDGAPLIAVEGYIDVIAMVTAGFPATVAPLGTALTDDQLGLLWRMADEPFSVLTAMPPAGAPLIGLLILHCRRCGLAKVCFSPPCPTARIRMISRAPVGELRSRMFLPRRARSPTFCGRAKPKPVVSILRSAARDSRRSLPKSHRRFRTQFGNIIARTSTRVCVSCSPPPSRSNPAALLILNNRASRAARHSAPRPWSRARDCPRARSYAATVRHYSPARP